MKLRGFNSEGIREFENFLDSLKNNNDQPVPREMLTDNRLTEPVSPPIEIESRGFVNRFEAAEYLYNCFNGSNFERVDLDTRKGIWAWLSLFFFDQLCPAKENENRNPKELARWVLDPSGYRYYRHLLAGPYVIYKTFTSELRLVDIVLCGPLHQPGDIVEQVVSRPEIITNPELMKVITTLYYDREAGKPKKGAAGKGAGSVRRLCAVLKQFDTTMDLYSISASKFIEMLPAEFDRFKP